MALNLQNRPGTPKCVLPQILQSLKELRLRRHVDYFYWNITSIVNREQLNVIPKAIARLTV